MTQFSYEPATEAELAWLINKLREDEKFFRGQTIFIQIYFSRFSKDEADSLLCVFKRELPRAKIVGMSLFGDNFLKINSKKFLRVNICYFESSDVSIFQYEDEISDVEKVSRDIRAKIAAVKNVKGVLILGSGSDFQISRFMEEITFGFENIPFFGSVANINSADLSYTAPFAVGFSVFSRGVLIAIFSGENLNVYSESVFGWHRIGKSMPITLGKSHKFGDTTIEKIDGIPATQIYQKYFNVECDRYFVANICEFPLAFERNGYVMARIPCGFGDSGEIYLLGDVKEDEKIRFTYGKTEDILEKSWQSGARMADFSPQAIFLFVCANRAIFLKDKAHEEIDEYKKIAAGTLFCHGSAELYRYKNQATY